MSHERKLRAWIEPTTDGQFLAAFVSVAAVPGGRPATRPCASLAEGTLLVEDLAASINFEVEWVEPPAGRVPAAPTDVALQPT